MAGLRKLLLHAVNVLRAGDERTRRSVCTSNGCPLAPLPLSMLFGSHAHNQAIRSSHHPSVPRLNIFGRMPLSQLKGRSAAVQCSSTSGDWGSTCVEKCGSTMGSASYRVNLPSAIPCHGKIPTAKWSISFPAQSFHIIQPQTTTAGSRVEELHAQYYLLRQCTRLLFRVR